MCFLLIFGGGFSPLAAEGKPSRAYNQMALEVPTDGGGMLMYSRMWVLNKYLEGGFSVGGGVIDRDFDLTAPGSPTLKGHTQTLVLPYIGPRITAIYHVIGISIGYGIFYADSDFKVEWLGEPRLTGRKSGWGSGFYSPLLVIQFLDPRYNVVYGFGLGGFFGTSFPKLKATSSTSVVTTTENPIDTLTLHLSYSWGPNSGRKSNRDEW